MGSEKGHIFNMNSSIYYLHTLSLPAALCSRMLVRMLIIITLFVFIVSNYHPLTKRGLIVLRVQS